MKKSLLALTTAGFMAVSGAANADWSATVNLASDYTFNGVSQTSNDPALQASLDYSGDNGFYAGTWASNVDFGGGDDTDTEWDFYIGKYYQLDEKFSLDLGIAYYSYHGASYSDDYNYPEAYAKFGYASDAGQTEMNFWYSWDYFGVDVDHYIAMVAHTFTLAKGHDIRISFDRSLSDDENKWAWDGDNGYNHYRLEYMTSYKGFDFNLAWEDTDMDIDVADSRVVFSVSRTFSL